MLGSTFVPPAFDCGICTYVSVNLLAKSNGAPVIVGTAKPSGAYIIDSSTLRGTLHNHVLPSQSAAKLVTIALGKADHNLATFPYH